MSAVIETDTEGCNTELDVTACPTGKGFAQTLRVPETSSRATSRCQLQSVPRRGWDKMGALLPIQPPAYRSKQDFP